MPTYQYRCTQCGHDLEAVQKFSDPALTECPSCSGQLRKVYNAVGVVFKGSGFYRTDSRANQGTADGGQGTSGHETKVSDGTSNGSSDTSGKPGKSGKSEKAADSGSSSGAKTDGTKTPAKAGAGSSTGSSSTG